MKKFLLSIFLVLILATSSFAFNLPKNVYNANTLQIYMRQNFFYTRDVIPYDYFEYVQLPHILEFTRQGDCDDFATYSFFWLKQLNYDAHRYILIIDNEGISVGHAITVFLDDDHTYSIFTNQYILKTNKKVLIDAIKDIYPHWEIIALWLPIKYGLLSVQELYENIFPIEFRSEEIRQKYLQTKYEIKHDS